MKKDTPHNNERMEAVRLYQEGAGFNEIARRLRRDRKTVEYYIHRWMKYGEAAFTPYAHMKRHEPDAAAETARRAKAEREGRITEVIGRIASATVPVNLSAAARSAGVSYSCLHYRLKKHHPEILEKIRSPRQTAHGFNRG